MIDFIASRSRIDVLKYLRSGVLSVVETQKPMVLIIFGTSFKSLRSIFESLFVSLHGIVLFIELYNGFLFLHHDNLF